MALKHFVQVPAYQCTLYSVHDDLVHFTVQCTPLLKGQYSTVAIYLRTPTSRLCVGIGPTLRKDDRCDSTLAIYLRTPTRRLLRMSEVKRKP